MVHLTYLRRKRFQVPPCRAMRELHVLVSHFHKMDEKDRYHIRWLLKCSITPSRSQDPHLQFSSFGYDAGCDAF